MLPSLDKGRHGFDGQKWAHTASSPLTIRQVFSAGLSLSGRISAPAKLPAPDRNGFSSDFCFLRRRWAGAHQGEKSKKRRKDALSGVFALVERWYNQTATSDTLAGLFRRVTPPAACWRPGALFMLCVKFILPHPWLPPLRRSGGKARGACCGNQSRDGTSSSGGTSRPQRGTHPRSVPCQLPSLPERR